MEIKMPHYKFHSGKTLTEDSKVFKIYKIKDPVCHPYNNHIFCRVYQKHRNFHVLFALVNLYRFLTSKLILACPHICYIIFTKSANFIMTLAKPSRPHQLESELERIDSKWTRYSAVPLHPTLSTVPNLTFTLCSWGFAKTF